MNTLSLRGVVVEVCDHDWCGKGKLVVSEHSGGIIFL